MGVTDLQPYFTQTIGNNSVNVNRIPTKLGTEVRLNEPLRMPNFSSIGARIRVLWRILRGVRKEEEKTPPNFGRSYFGNGWSDFLQMWNVDSPT